MKGAFQTSREIFENPIWQDIPKFRIFFFIVGNAVFSEAGTTVAGMHLKRGQYLRSYRNLRTDLEYLENRSVKKYSLSVISRKIDQLVKEERLKIEETELGTLFTVVNYSTYQGFDHYKKGTWDSVGTDLEQGWNRDGTVLEQGWNNNNKDKKDIKDNKDNKEKSSTTAPPDDESFMTVMDAYTKVFGTFSMTGLMQGYIGELRKLGCNDSFITELLLESGESSNSGKPNLNFVRAIGDRWMKENISTREQAKQAKESQKPANDSRNKPYSKKTGHSGKEVIPIASNDNAPEVSEDDFDRYMREAAEIQASKAG